MLVELTCLEQDLFIASRCPDMLLSDLAGHSFMVGVEPPLPPVCTRLTTPESPQISRKGIMSYADTRASHAQRPVHHLGG